jgi:hypothetical protein
MIACRTVLVGFLQSSEGFGKYFLGVLLWDIE